MNSGDILKQAQAELEAENFREQVEKKKQELIAQKEAKKTTLLQEIFPFVSLSRFQDLKWRFDIVLAESREWEKQKFRLMEELRQEKQKNYELARRLAMMGA